MWEGPTGTELALWLLSLSWSLPSAGEAKEGKRKESGNAPIPKTRLRRFTARAFSHVCGMKRRGEGFDTGHRWFSV